MNSLPPEPSEVLNALSPLAWLVPALLAVHVAVLITLAFFDRWGGSPTRPPRRAGKHGSSSPGTPVRTARDEVAEGAAADAGPWRTLRASPPAGAPVEDGASVR